MARTPRTARQEDNITAEAWSLCNMVQARFPFLVMRTHRCTSQLKAVLDSKVLLPVTRSLPLPVLSQHPVRMVLMPEVLEIGNTPREEPMRTAVSQRSLKLGFASLPKPSNDFEVVLPEDEEEVEEEVEEDERTMTVEDMAERNARMKKLQEEEEREALERQTSVALQTTPYVPSALSGAQALIDPELVDLIQLDGIAHPLLNTPLPMYDISTTGHACANR
ncbi:Pre-mRNA-splicing factor cef1 [Ceratobasidium sp. 428]|nr:Pre-mRNA-splicing factor cef1 [Ceratobasidium sp. 428]